MWVYQKHLPWYPTWPNQLYAHPPCIISRTKNTKNITYTKTKSRFVYVKINKSIYSLPQTGSLVKKLPNKCLEPEGYFEVPHMTGLWKHIYKSIQFTLVVYNFGIKFTNKKHVYHLINALKNHDQFAKDWTGSLYCGIGLKWEYDNCTLKIFIMGYIKKLLQKYNHIKRKKFQHTSYQPAPHKYGKSS